ncbi:MAG: LCP family protein [Anaerolineales bacterium]
MKRFILLAAALAVGLASCRPGQKMENQAPRLPKAGTPIGPGTPMVGVEALPTETLGPPPGPGQLFPHVFPPAFSYGPKYPPVTPIPAPVQPHHLAADAINILLLGSDRRSGTAFRTDTILVLSLQPSAGGAALISIPRDLYVYLPGFNMQRINTALILGDEYGYPGGGRAMLSDALQYNLGIPVHYYAQVEMGGFRKIVDRLDGIEVRVACPYTDWRLRRPDLNPNVEANWALFTVPTGVVHMDGDYALWYARSRARSSDFDRARRQQEVLRAIHRRVLHLDLIPKIPDLYNELIQAVSTDMSLADILRLAPLAVQIDGADVRSRFIGRDEVTSWRTPTGGQVLLPKPAEIASLLDEALDFDTVSEVVPEASFPIEIINGSDHPDYGELAAERLTYAGYKTRVLRSGAEPTTRSRLLDYGLASPDIRNGILSALGLPASVVETAQSTSGSAAFRLVVGQSFNPCFNPTRNQ